MKDLSLATWFGSSKRIGKIQQTLYVLLGLVFCSNSFASVILHQQNPIGGSPQFSYVTLDASTNVEAADDFNLVADIDRVTFWGSIWSATAVHGVYIRFYEVDPTTAKPGTLQKEYFVPAGDANLAASYDWVSVTLATPFNASGQHFIAAQILTDADWRTDGSDPKNGSLAYIRSGNGVWENTSIATDLGFTLYGTPGGAPVLESVSATSATRSGYFELTGSGFGDQGQLVVAGSNAHIASWSNNKIQAYVNENTPLGDAAVQVITANGNSGSLALTVTERAAPTQHLLWQFQYTGSYSMVAPVSSADGKLYAVDVSGYVYSLNQDGSLNWVRATGNSDGGLDIGADGTIYIGGHSAIVAYNPQGDMLWRFNLLDQVTYTFGDVKVGPDGNLYVGTTGSIGLFSLSPGGQLRWNTAIDPVRGQRDYGQIAFGDNGGKTQLYFNTGLNTLAFDMNGNPLFSSFGHNPVVAPNNNIYLGPYIVSPDGNLLCSVSDGGGEPAVANANTRYGARLDLFAHNSTCGETARFGIPQYANSAPVLSTDESVLVLSSALGSGESISYALETSSGIELWRQYYPVIEGQNQFIFSKAVFVANDSLLLVNTGVSGSVIRGFLSALSVQTSSGGPVNQNPVADPQSVNTVQDSAVAILLSGSDPNGDALSYTLVESAGPFSGSLTGTPPSLLYTPAPGYVGSDRFDFFVTDGKGGSSAPATVSISISQKNNPPQANNDSATLVSGSEIVLNILANDVDPDGDKLQVNSVQADRNLRVQINADQTVTITNKRGFVGVTSFSYDVIDIAGNISNTAHVSVTVEADPNGSSKPGKGNK